MRNWGLKETKETRRRPECGKEEGETATQGQAPKVRLRSRQVPHRCGLGVRGGTSSRKSCEPLRLERGPRRPLGQGPSDAGASGGLGGRNGAAGCGEAGLWRRHGAVGGGRPSGRGRPRALKGPSTQPTPPLGSENR